MKDINEVLKMDEYAFVKNEPRLGNNICLLTFGGSIAYGLDGPTSDIDVRGVCLPSKNDILCTNFALTDEDRRNGNVICGSTGFEQYVNVATDTTIYSLDKFFKLLHRCNPNVIEILGCKKEHYAMISPAGQKLLDNRHVFLSKLAYGSFSGFARSQFERLKNALGNGGESQLGQILCLADSIERMQQHLEYSYPTYNRDMISLSVKNADGSDVYVNGNKVLPTDLKLIFDDKSSMRLTAANDVEIPDNEDIGLYLNINMDGVYFKDFSGIINEVTTAIKEFNKHIGHRNNKKDDYHLNKHAMHLVRLYLMAFDILEREEIVTYRDKERDFLLSIKNGDYMVEGTRAFKPEFYALISDYEKKLKETYKSCKLPAQPDNDAIVKLLNEIYIENVFNK